MSKKESITIDKIFADAQNEVNAEVIEKSKFKIKEKIRLRAQAQRVLKNLDREIEELKLEIAHELGE